jgi:hypothetical protein
VLLFFFGEAESRHVRLDAFTGSGCVLFVVQRRCDLFRA